MDSQTDASFWRKCSSCKKAIAFKQKHWVCNVSTCNRKRTGLVFCSVSCWDAHLPLMNHRESWAEERTSPSAEAWLKEQQNEQSSHETSTKEIQKMETTETTTNTSEVLVVASKLKNYIRESSGMNTSAAVMDALSSKVRELCDQAVARAKQDGRKTVMDRDFQ